MDPRKTTFARAAGATAGPTFGVDRSASTADTTKVYLYDAIGEWFGLSARRFVQVLADIDTPRIELHVNSPGGDAYDGIAMANALRDHDAHVVAVVDGLAASAASMVIMGADEVVMAPNSELMIHDAWTITLGSAAELRKDADRLDKLSTNYSRAYAAKASGEPDDWRALMLEETWFLADEAVAAGLADRELDAAPDGTADDDAQTAVAAKDRWDLSIFRHAGRADAPAPALRPAALTAAGSASPTRADSGVPELLIRPSASAAGSTPPAATAPSGDTKKEESMPMTDEQFAALTQKVGVAADADADTVLAALDEALAEQAEARPEGLAAGTRVVDSATYEDLLSRAADGDRARQEQAQARRVAAVNAAVNEGKIQPERRDHWLTLLKNDEEGTTATLAALAAGTIPVSETGHADTVTESDEGFAEYEALGYGRVAKED